jgi:hypothetical protein
MNEEQLTRIEDKQDKLITVLLGDEKEPGFFQRVRNIEQNCTRNHENMLLKYGPFTISAGMFAIAIVALWVKTK